MTADRAERAGIVVLVVAALAAAGAGPQGVPTNPTAAVLADFAERVQAYVALRKSLESQGARPTSTDAPEKIEAAQGALADRIRARRAGAKRGDLFTPPARAVFVTLLNPTLKGGEGAENTNAIRDDNPGSLPLAVNTPYPKNAPLSIVPPDVLAALPKLPDELEYRFVGTHLILYDARAGLVVDYIPNAVQKAKQ